MKNPTEFDRELFSRLNKAFAPLYARANELCNALKVKGFNANWKYASMHVVKVDNKFETECYPIPLITVRGVCDIGVGPHNIFIEGKLKRETAIGLDYSLLSGYYFEIYGADNFCFDFYTSDSGDHMSEINNRILESEEKEICVSVLVHRASACDALINAVIVFNQWHTTPNS